MQVEQLLELLVCPKCRSKLRAVDLSTTNVRTGGAEQGLLCEACQLLYAIDDGLPNMLVGEARSWPLASEASASANP